MTPAEILKLLIVASVVGSVFSLALRSHPQDALYLFRRPALALRALVAMFLIVPIATLGLVVVLAPGPVVAITLLVLSLSPVPPLLPKKQAKAGAEASYDTGLLISAAIVSLLVMPIGLDLFSGFFQRAIAPVPLSGMVITLAITIVAPLAAGLAAQAVIKDRDRQTWLADVIGKGSGIILIVCALVLVAFLFPSLSKVVGGGALVAIVAMILVGLAAGWALGGPPSTNKPALALAAASRHPGIAIGVINASFPEEGDAVLAVIVFLLANTVVTALFTRKLASLTPEAST
jgi:BASS family bile acid:Na+ symporter